ncbi:hypothetical protein [Ensifer aridi]|uniref:hypothetical protein n=1 Tax=Ensifer aridi TaxID=1708715 RepID=UPI0003FB29FB|nr:hypothetical protein [Ensifer aridi]
MIEYALLFALGFLTAVVIALLVAPAIQRRIVRFAEDRLKATMPLSPQEVRAQRDAARATYAAENAKTMQTLRRERDKSVALMLQNERTLKEARKLASENVELQSQLADMNVEAADMRSTMRQLEQRLERMSALNSQVDKHAAELDGLKIDLAARQTEIEHLKSRIATLRDEREALRAELKTENARAREMELRLSRDEGRIRQLESRLAHETAANADRESALEQRAAEIARLKTRVELANHEVRNAAKALRAAGVKPPKRPHEKSAAHVKDAPTAAEGHDTAALSEDLRNRATALSERLVNSKSTAHDEALRREVAEVAAGMVALTAMREGKASPIHGLLAGEDATKPGNRQSLAQRAKEMLPPE